MENYYFLFFQIKVYLKTQKKNTILLLVFLYYIIDKVESTISDKRVWLVGLRSLIRLKGGYKVKKSIYLNIL